MNITITTTRLTIRNFVESDWPYVYEYTKDDKAMCYVNHGTLSLSETMRLVHDNIGGKPIAFPIIKTDTNQLIGHITFSPYKSAHTYEIGWIIHPQFQKQGFATEAALAFIVHAFRYMKMHRIIARCAVVNNASWQVMERIGLRREAHFIKNLPFGEKDWLDEYVYATLRSEWLDKLSYPYVATFKSNH